MTALQDNQDTFLEIFKDHECGDIDFGNEDSNQATPTRKITPQPLGAANAVSSHVQGTELPAMHRPVLDLDMRCLLFDSSTPGHHHLYIDHQMPWEDYKKLLNVLAEVGLLQPGYVSVSLKRERTWLRTPWTKKEENR